MTTKREFRNNALWFDPPNGHAYGFPIVFPENLDPTCDADIIFLLGCLNYPAKDVNLALRHSRWFGNLDRVLT